MTFLPEVLTTNEPDAAVLGLWILINAFAVARIARFIAVDTLIDRPRQKFQARFEGSLVELVTCPWCLSVWFAAAATVLTCAATTRGWWLLTAIGLGIAWLAGALNEWA
jgi:hypothetical protein